MKIAIIGGGFTGLTAAYELAKKGHRVTVFEKDKVLGGLAHGFKPARRRGGRTGWEWYLESAYHHLFTNDKAILGLISELGLEDKLIIKRPITANYVRGKDAAPVLSTNNELSPNIRIKKTRTYSYIRTDSLFDDESNIYQFDSLLHLLTYPRLSLLDKLRTGFLLASIKLNPFWQPFEWLTAKQLFLTIGGKAAWQAIWEPLMIGKFGPYADRVAASWLWARIKKRTPRLIYIEGGFQTLVSALEEAIIHHGGTIKKNCIFDYGRILKYNSFSHTPFDRILLTIPVPTAIPHLHAQTLILETKEPILKDAYWLNITDRAFPFLAVVAHTNFMDPKYYGGHHITYLGNYLPDGHPFLSLTKDQLLKKFLPFIKRLSPTSHFSLLTSHLFTGLYAQPVHQLHYSRRAPKLETPVKGVYLANMDSIYPWDRGTNYAVELGQKAAQLVIR